MTFKNILYDFVSNTKNPRCQLSVIATGGGASLAQLMTIPGASKFVDEMVFPYERETVAEHLDLLGNQNSKLYFEKSVRPEVASDLAEIAARRSKHALGIGITASLTTSRNRKGDNVAFICLCDREIFYDQMVQLKFQKLNDNMFLDNRYTPIILEKREEEDQIIAQVVLALVYGYDKWVLTELEQDGILKWIKK